LTAAQNVAYPLHARRLARREVRRQAEEIITAFGIAGIVGLSGGHLSGGQAARVGLARALAAARGLVLLDEPFAALDPAAARDLRGRLSEWLDRTRQTCLMVSHEARDQVGDWDLTVELGSGRPRIAVL
jgi:ABC-type sulfate/molybdate transport systems ATPase subunit